MISTKRLIKLAKKWQKHAAIRREWIIFSQNVSDHDANRNCSTLTIMEKGHFVVYSIDQRRFVLPLAYLNKEIVQELFILAEEEFGISSSGHITLPFDVAFLEYVITLIKQKVDKAMKNALLMSITSSNRCSSALLFSQEVGNQQLRISSY